MAKRLGCSIFIVALLAGCAAGGNRPAMLPAASSQVSAGTTPATDGLRPAGFDGENHIMIADQFNNRVIEINRDHRIVWSFGDGSSVAGPHSVVAPNDEERYGEFTLIAGTGAPQGSEPGCMNAPCQDNRVIVVNRAGEIVWQYGKTGQPGSGPDELNTPVCAVRLPNRDVLITDQANERVIQVNEEKRIVWQYGTTGTSGAGYDELNNPNCAELLDNGHILIADENNNRVIEVTRDKQIVWRYGSPSDTKRLNGAAFASRLRNGDTLITDSLNNRILEVSAGKNVVWRYVTNKRKGSVANPNPTRAVRLRNGDTLISDQFNMQVIEVNRDGKIVFRQGKIGVAGTGPDELNAPYDAKVVGDFTGLTPPH
ncbi:MAG: hypothetical protein JO030_01725 [Candidatus Eremiobacteraeota bacterium]|nr:hypothetical protein [Candidatus Eremiobacteraeota bacterium]